MFISLVIYRLLTELSYQHEAFVVTKLIHFRILINPSIFLLSILGVNYLLVHNLDGSVSIFDS